MQYINELHGCVFFFFFTHDRHSFAYFIIILRLSKIIRKSYSNGFHMQISLNSVFDDYCLFVCHHINVQQTSKLDEIIE